MALQYSIGNNIDFRKKTNSNYYSLDGFSWSQMDGTWLDGNEASLMLNVSSMANQPLKLKFRSPHIFCPNNHRPHVEICINNNIVFEKLFSEEDRDQTQISDIPKNTLEPNQINHISFRLRNPLMPTEALPHSDDDRILSIMLSDLSIEA